MKYPAILLDPTQDAKHSFQLHYLLLNCLAVVCVMDCHSVAGFVFKLPEFYLKMMKNTSVVVLSVWICQGIVNCFL
jgi:hypothetical protein